jgi:acetyl-CoA acetyltransferase
MQQGKTAFLVAGASGARLALTAALELSDRAPKRALTTMCIGVGQGITVLLEAA